MLRQVEYADRLQQAQRAEGVDVGRVLGRVEGDLHVTLRGEVVDLVGPRLLHDADEVGGVGEVAVMEEEAHLLRVGVGVEVVDAVGVKLRGPPLNAVHLVALAQQQLRQIRPVLPGHAGDEGDGPLAAGAGAVVWDFRGYLLVGRHVQGRLLW